QAAEVVDGANGHGHRRAEQQTARLAAERQERERRHEDPEEEGDAAEARHGRAVEAAAARRVDDAEQTRHAAPGRGQQGDDEERDERAPYDLEVIPEDVEDAVVDATARVAEDDEHAGSLASGPGIPATRSTPSDSKPTSCRTAGRPRRRARGR